MRQAALLRPAVLGRAGRGRQAGVSARVAAAAPDVELRPRRARSSADRAGKGAAAWARLEQAVRLPLDKVLDLDRCHAAPKHAHLGLHAHLLVRAQVLRGLGACAGRPGKLAPLCARVHCGVRDRV